MSYSVTDSANNSNWPATEVAINENNTIDVVMAGVKGFNDLTTGNHRAGYVIISPEMYSVNLPGTPKPGAMSITFQRIM